MYASLYFAPSVHVKETYRKLSIYESKFQKLDHLISFKVHLLHKRLDFFLKTYVSVSLEHKSDGKMVSGKVENQKHQ